MADAFREMCEGLKQAGEGLQAAIDGTTRAIRAALEAKTEHEDLRETVQRLEALVTAQAADIRALRSRLDADRMQT